MCEGLKIDAAVIWQRGEPVAFEIPEKRKGRSRLRLALARGQCRPDSIPSGSVATRKAAEAKGWDHSRPLRFSAWRRYQVRRDISSLSQGFLASLVLARSSIRGRPVLRARFTIIFRIEFEQPPIELLARRHAPCCATRCC